MRVAVSGILVLVAALGCAAKQKVPIECVPQGVVVYVDQEMLEEMPDELELRTDRHHVLYFKGEGYRPETVVLESNEVDGVHQLSPATVCVEPVYVGTGRKIEVEIEEKEEP